MARAKGNSVERRCPACEAVQARALGEKDGLALKVCGACGTLYARGDNAVPLNYIMYYGESNLSVPDFIGHRCDEIAAAFAPHRKTNRLLDIGCGAGTLLRAARRAGWDAEGLEVSIVAVEHLRADGFKVFQGELAEASYPEGHFDVVMAIEVLEHIAEPAQLVEEIARILRPGGLMWATTPHGRGLSARLLGLDWSAVNPPEHLQLFSLEGVRRMMRRAGFRRVNVTTRACNPLEIWHALMGRNNGAQAPKDKSVAVRHSAGALEWAAMERAQGIRKPANGQRFDRVATSYRLNEALLRNPATRTLKAAINAALCVARLGDSILIRAER